MSVEAKAVCQILEPFASSNPPGPHSSCFVPQGTCVSFEPMCLLFQDKIRERVIGVEREKEKRKSMQTDLDLHGGTFCQTVRLIGL
eukprot:1018872-Pelagomonas_calceolata.AAC.2